MTPFQTAPLQAADFSQHENAELRRNKDGGNVLKVE